MFDFTAGDRIALKAAFLRSICDYSHRTASRRGTVVGRLNTAGGLSDLLEVRWDDTPDGTTYVNRHNVRLVGSLHTELA